MSEAIHTAGDLRGFLAGVLLDIKAKRIKPEEAVSIAKVAAEINKSLAVEVQTALAAGVKEPVPGSMVIGRGDQSEPIAITDCGDADTDFDVPEPKLQTCAIPQADVIDPAKVAPIAKIPTMTDATANYRKNRDGDKVWCEQCEMRVTTSQAIGCKSPFCKAREAA